MRDEVSCVYRRLIYLLSRYLIWGGKYRPSRMFAGGRQFDKVFYPDEVLYFRCKKDWIDGNEKSIKPASFPIPNQSVNRNKYSKPKDVLIPNNEEKTKGWIFWGVARIFVKDIPEGVETEGSIGAKKVYYKFGVAHDPEEDNFGHSEIRVYKDGGAIKKVNSKEVKKVYRTNLSFKSRIIVKPRI